MARVLASLVALALGGCVAAVPAPRTPTQPQPRATGAAAPTRAPLPRPRTRVAVPMSLPGLEAVIGAHAATLVGRFGTPRLDIREGDARKLQFAGGACVLDVYLYPPGEGGEPRATYVDARLADGRDTDRAGCVAALGRK